jgi:hypothetical protein
VATSLPSLLPPCLRLRLVAACTRGVHRDPHRLGDATASPLRQKGGGECGFAVSSCVDVCLSMQAQLWHSTTRWRHASPWHHCSMHHVLFSHTPSCTLSMATIMRLVLTPANTPSPPPTRCPPLHPRHLTPGGKVVLMKVDGKSELDGRRGVVHASPSKVR